jgi:hypothetical protein
MLISALMAALGSIICGTAYAATGPTQTPLRVTALWTKSPSSAIYVQFQPGAMPGCYNNAGGYVYSSNAFFKEIYAQLLMLSANGGQRAAIIYTQNASTGNWSDCTVDGIYLQPE